MKQKILLLGALTAALLFGSSEGFSQNAQTRMEIRNQIRRDKFDYILPQAMRENGIDMWITVQKEGNYDPLWLDLGPGEIGTGSIGFIIFTDRGGNRIERAALGIGGREIRGSGAYDIFGSPDGLKEFVTERDPKRIGVNMSENYGRADGISHSEYEYLVRTLGKPYDSRIVSAEKLVSDFFCRRVASEIVVFGEAARISMELAERALSNEVIIPGKTSLEEVAWWLQNQLDARGLESTFGFPSVYITGPDGIVAGSNGRLIQRGDIVAIDWGAVLMGYYPDMKRMAYVLKEGEMAASAGIQNAFDRGLAAREIIRASIKPNRTGKEAIETMNRMLTEAGFDVMKEFNKITNSDKTEIANVTHSVGDWGHGIGPSTAFFHERQQSFKIVPGTFLTIELVAYTAAPEWGGKKVRIPLEDDAVVTERGVEWLYPSNQRILLIK
jgi:Xaa-Pro aminopeptidase